jgi:hypothetical protein
VTHLIRSLAVVAAIGLLWAPLDAQTPALAGRWKMVIQFNDEPRPAGLEILLKGNAVSGKFVAAFAGGDVPIEGELAGRTVTFSASTTGGPHPGMQLDFSATLNGDGTLTGKMSAPFGDLTWTAERLD